jgi:L-fuconolactonase
VRHLIHNEADSNWLLQDTVTESLGILADHGLSYDVVGVIPAHIRAALKVAEKVPELRMVFDHLNQPPIGKEGWGEWGELMKEAAGHENFYVKISGLGTASGNFESWKAADLEPAINFVLQHFGADRCFCGGDWPVSLLAGSYEKVWKAYRDILKGLPGREKLLYKNAQHFYGLIEATR